MLLVECAVLSRTKGPRRANRSWISDFSAAQLASLLRDREAASKLAAAQAPMVGLVLLLVLLLNQHLHLNGLGQIMLMMYLGGRHRRHHGGQHVSSSPVLAGSHEPVGQLQLRKRLCDLVHRGRHLRLRVLSQALQSRGLLQLQLCLDGCEVQLLQVDLIGEIHRVPPDVLRGGPVLG